MVTRVGPASRVTVGRAGSSSSLSSAQILSNLAYMPAGAAMLAGRGEVLEHRSMRSNALLLGCAAASLQRARRT
jgi:hypothetical protein